MKFQKVSEFAKQILTGSRNRAEVVLRNMCVAACGILQLFAQNLAQRTARDCGNFEIFLNNTLLVNFYIQADRNPPSIKTAGFGIGGFDILTIDGYLFCEILFCLCTY